SSVLYVGLLILALGTKNRPFPGFFLDPNLVVNDNGSSHWPGKQQGLRWPERLTAINGEPLASRAELDERLDAAAPGDEWEMTFVHQDGSSRTLTLPLFTLSEAEFGRHFWLPYLIGAF